MSRQVSAAVRTLLDSTVAETHDTVDIILPLKPGQTEVDRIKYYLASASGISYNGNLYLPMIRSFGTLRFTLGRANDGADISVENVSRTFGSTLSDASRKLEGASVIIRRAFRTAPEIYDPVDLLHGSIKQVKLNQESVNISIVSDMSRRGAQVASRTITQRCIWTFRGPECGWTTDQGGDPVFCNKVYEDALGCFGHNNQPRFGGVPTLSPSVRVQTGVGYWNGWEPINPVGIGNHWLDPDFPIYGYGQQQVGMQTLWNIN